MAQITRKTIEAYLELDAQRKALSRQASDLKKKQDELEEQLKTFVRESGERTVKRSGYVLSLTTEKGSVAWKGEFVKLAGQQRAEELIAAAPTKEGFSVEAA